MSTQLAHERKKSTQLAHWKGMLVPVYLENLDILCECEECVQCWANQHHHPSGTTPPLCQCSLVLLISPETKAVVAVMGDYQDIPDVNL